MHGEHHYQALQNMYLAAPINAIFRPRMVITHERAEIEMAIGEHYFHAAGAVHGCVYFKMLDDAAFFAANSIVPNFFVLTVSFTTYLIRPVSTGRLRSIGRVVSQTRTQILAESVAYNDAGEEVARGNGLFVRSKIRLTETMGYSVTVRPED